MRSQQEQIKVLLVEDNPGDARIIYEMLKDVSHIEFMITHVERLEKAMIVFEEEVFDVVLLDLGLPDSQGFKTFYQLRGVNEEVPIILLTGLNDESNAIQTVQSGAQDYLNKNDVTEALLVKAIMYAIERQQLMLELKRRSLRDDLTGLYNRRGFFHLANRELKIAERVNRGFLIIYIDLDNFKKLNDELGHSAGDQSLMDMANILENTFRESDIIARLGGDEFVILAFSDDEGSDQVITARLMGVIDEYNQQQKRPYQLSASIGIAKSRDENAMSIDELLKTADRRMYQHKFSKTREQGERS